MVLTEWYDWEFVLKFEAEGPEFAKCLRSRTIYWNSERSDQLLKQNAFKLIPESVYDLIHSTIIIHTNWGRNRTVKHADKVRKDYYTTIFGYSKEPASK